MQSVTRTSLRCLFVLSMLIASAVREPTCSADPPSDEAVMEQRRTQARAKYQDGAAAYSAGRYKDAVDSFLAADRLAPSAPLSFNIARAYEKLGDDAGSLRWYRDYLRRNPSAANAAAVQGLISGLAHRLQGKGIQQLTVITSPAGATVSVDDQPVGVSPWTGELSPGKHHLLLSERGYSDEQLDVTLAADEPSTETVRLTQQVLVAAPSRTEPELAKAAAPASGPLPPPPPHGKKLGPVPWVVLGAGTVALGGALTFELLRRSAEHDARRETTQLGYQDRLDSEQSRQTTARVLLGAGGTLLAAGGLMLLLDTGSAPAGASAGLVCLPGECGVTARGRF